MQIALGQKQHALHHSTAHMVAFGAGHDLVLLQEADGIDGTMGTACGNIHLGHAYHIPVEFGGASVTAGWERRFRASEVEVFQLRYTV